jgi:uncharacterized membrane protein YhaH (DUF805 family)
MTPPQFFRAMVGPFGRLLDFSGRSRRADFWPYLFLLCVVYLFGFYAIALMDISASPMLQVMALMTVLMLLATAAFVRRLHDVGWSGLWFLPCLAGFLIFGASLWYRHEVAIRDPGDGFRSSFALLGPLMVATQIWLLLNLVVAAMDGTAGPNRFGPDPKERGGAAPPG